MHAHSLVNFGVLTSCLALYGDVVVPAEHQKIRAPGDNRAENSLIPAYIIHTADVINTPIVYIHPEKS
jgi:hypothetical protein